MILTSLQLFALIDELEPFGVYNVDMQTCSFGDKATIITFGKKAKDITKRDLFWSPKNQKWVTNL